MPDSAAKHADLSLHVLWACVLLVAARIAAKAAETVATKSLEAARLTGEMAVRASDATGARAAAAFAAALAEPARRSADAAEKLADAVHDFRRVRCAQRSCHARVCRSKHQLLLPRAQLQSCPHGRR